MGRYTAQATMIRSEIDIIDFASRYTQLVQSTNHGEFCGPCPVCKQATTDGFYCSMDQGDGWWACRKCTANVRDDIISLYQKLEGSSYADTIHALTQELSGNAPILSTYKPIAPRVKDRVVQFDLDYWQPEINKYQKVLWRNGSSAALDYLRGRALDDLTLAAFGIGERVDCPLPGTDGSMMAPAATIPWLDPMGIPFALCYRFLCVHTYGDKNGKPMTIKTASRGNRSNQLFGAHLLRGHFERDTLAIVEGEINAMSIWQVANTYIDVVSPGSESCMIRLSDNLKTMAAQYDRVLFWADDPKIRSGAKQQIPGCYTVDETGDANDALSNKVLIDIINRHRPQRASIQRTEQIMIPPLMTKDLDLAWRCYEHHRHTGCKLYSMDDYWVVSTEDYTGGLND